MLWVYVLTNLDNKLGAEQQTVAGCAGVGKENEIFKNQKKREKKKNNSICF